MKSLAEIFNQMAVHDGVDSGHNDKGTTHSYIDTYERLLAPFREKCSFMEIGLAMGKSLDLWGEYFGPDSRIVGVDISIVFDTQRFDPRINIIQADATKPEFMELLEGEVFDVIIDDGSHMENDQKATFGMMKSFMNPGGIYIIEDILSLDISGPNLRAMHDNCEVIDLRGVKGRFDDVLLVYRF